MADVNLLVYTIFSITAFALGVALAGSLLEEAKGKYQKAPVKLISRSRKRDLPLRRRQPLK